MTIKSKTIHDGEIAIIEVRGSLTGDEDTDRFREEVADFLEQGSKSLIIDLQRVNYMNSLGLGAVLSAHASFKKNDGEIKLVGISKNIRNLFTITRLISIFDVQESVDEAVESFLEKNSKSH
jgi:anti-sigma B factor antagonist